MILKGFASDFKPFLTVIIQRKDELKFNEFKSALRRHEETERFRKNGPLKDYSMNVHIQQKDMKNIQCFNCQKLGHRHFECNNASKFLKRWCEYCKRNTHYTKYCRNKRKENSVNSLKDTDEKNSFLFTVSTFKNLLSMIHLIC